MEGNNRYMVYAIAGTTNDGPTNHDHPLVRAFQDILLEGREMSETKWTPGPWHVLGQDERDGGIPYIEINGGESGTSTYKAVADVCSSLTEDDEFAITETDEANANLIAAAPELYKALDELVKVCLAEQLIPPSITFIKMAQSAMAKANGETND